jgi:ABC-2 type transport system permease protein
LDRLIAIVFLKVRLALRQGRGGMQVVGLVLMVLFFIIPVGLAGGALSVVAFESLDAAGDREALHLLLTAIWLFWLIFPLVGFSLNQSYDLTRLFIYPLRRVTIFVGNVIGCFLDPTLLVVVPAFIAVAYFHSATSATGALIVLALALFLAHTIALSQAVLWALLNVLRSRRVRDWAILLAPLVAVAIYMAPHLLLPSTSGPDILQTVVQWRLSRYLRFTPMGVTAEAIGMAARARWWYSAGYLAASTAYLAAALALGAYVLGRLHSGEIGASPAREASRADSGRRPLLQRLATTPLAALAIKEIRYYWREPRYKSTFIAPIFPLIFIVGNAIIRRGLGPVHGVTLAAAFVLFGFSSLFQNVFGVDREGLRLLFATPCPREDILIGKNIAPVFVAWITSSVTAAIAGFILGDPYLAGAYVPFILATVIVFAAVGNVVSILFPVRLARRGENPFTSSPGRGCLSALTSSLTFLVALNIISVPIFIAAAVPLVIRMPAAYVVSVPAALVYAVGVYVAVLKGYSAHALASREMDILEECLTGEPG